jgi:predicted dehydrogenase
MGDHMAQKTRWGIISTGYIADLFAKGLQAIPNDAEIAAVGSRNQATADEFGARFNIPKRYASYQQVADDPDVDVIYIGTPHPMHIRDTMMCLRAGKAVLCEKPFAINTREAEEMVRFARDKKLFLMEAMWTRYFPLMVKVREMLANGVIGEVRMVQADFGFRANFNPQHRLFALEFGGGGLLDVGIYPLSLASMVLGMPTQVVGLAELGATGSDEQSAFILGYPGGQLAVLSCAVRTETPQEATIFGTEGRIRIHSQFWRPRTMTLTLNGKPDEVIEVSHEGNGYNYQALEVGNCLRAGKLESDIMPLDETLALMRTMDSLRAQWGLKYPME